ncbi:MAG: SDR family oxidoreductase [Alphaproteobacteria bacterium]|nr:SDR family oxidoreductase [Alphaproteobacteria bacterium]
MVNAAFDLRGKVALVSGAGKGLGKAVAIGLGRAGATVAVCARTLADVQATAKVIDGEALALRCDISRTADCALTVKAVTDRWGRLDIAVVCAATESMSSAEAMTDAMWDTCIATELTGYFRFAVAAARPMLAARAGSIVMFTANSSVVGYRELAGTAAAKGGVDQIVRNCAVEWGDRNVRINSVNCGYTDHLPPEGDVNPGEGDIEDEIRRTTPLQRRGRIEEFVDPTLFLASDASSFITGHNLMVDGGYTIK